MTVCDPTFAWDLLGSLRTGLVGIDAAGRVTALSDVAAEVLACGDARRALGESARTVLASQPEVWKLLESALDGRERPGRAELRLESRADGEPFTIGYTLVAVRGESGASTGAALLFRDLSTFERRAEQDRQRDRLLALGQMAAGMAHELRNPLASLEVQLGLLKRRIDGSEDQQLLEEALGEVRTLAATITGSLDFVRPVLLDRRPTPATELLEDALGRARARTPYQGEVAFSVDPDLGPLHVDPERLRKALVDLIANALEAMAEAPDRGPGELLLAAHPTPDGGARIEVGDRGPGVEPKLRERIFHPFFTTRAQGTGVGLAEVHKVVAAHGGQVEVEARPGGGALFRIHLPVGADGAEAA